MAEKTVKKKQEKEKPKKEEKPAEHKKLKEEAKKAPKEEKQKKTEKTETKEKTKETAKPVESKTYVVPLTAIFHRFRTRRAKRASKELKEFFARHIKKGEVKIDPSVNELIHSKGRCHVPRRVKVVAVTEGDKTTVKLAG